MKIAKVLWLSALCLLLSGCALLAGCDNRTDGLQALCSDAGLDLANAQVLSDDDDHGGFHGDGVRLAVVRFDAADAATLEAAGWSALPLPDDLASLLYEGMDGVWPSEVRIPKTETGFWYFRDRYDPKSPGYEQSFTDRSSYNFTVALYDSTAQTLYYCEMDT